MVIRKRLVRLHLKDKVTTIEGLLIGHGLSDYYTLDVADVIEDVDRSVPVGRVKVPKANVLFRQELR